MMYILLPVAAMCTAVVFMTLCLVLSALGHDKSAMASGALGILLPIILFASMFL